MTKRFLTYVILVATVGLIVLAVWVPRRKHSRDIMIGCAVPLSGESAQYGVACKRGVELAIEETNRLRTGSQEEVRVIFEDTQGLPRVAVSAVQKLVDVHGVVAVIGPLWSSCTLAAAPIAESRRVVLLSPGSSSPKITTAGDFVFRNEVSDSLGAVASANLYFQAGFRRIGILYVNNDYGVGVRDVTSKTYENLGGTVSAAEAFQQNATDFRTPISKIIASDPAAILIVGYKEQIQAVRQLRELGSDMQILGTPLMEDEEMLSKLGVALEGAIYSYYGSFDLENPDERSLLFVEQFRQRYGADPSYYAPIAYDAAMILVEAMRRGGSTAEEIKDQLYEIECFPGISGTTSFDRNGDVVKPVVLKTVRMGRFVRHGIQ